MRGGGRKQMKEKNYLYFYRILDNFLIPGNIQRITVRFLEFVPLPFHTTYEESHLYFEMETDVKYPSTFKIPRAGMWH